MPERHCHGAGRAVILSPGRGVSPGRQELLRHELVPTVGRQVERGAPNLQGVREKHSASDAHFCRLRGKAVELTVNLRLKAALTHRVPSVWVSLPGQQPIHLDHGAAVGRAVQRRPAVL